MNENNAKPHIHDIPQAAIGEIEPKKPLDNLARMMKLLVAKAESCGSASELAQISAEVRAVTKLLIYGDYFPMSSSSNMEL